MKNPLIPLQVKTREETRKKLKIIAEKNGLSLNDVASMAIAAGMPMIETKLREIHEPEPAKAA
jgi:hypothetical protein